MKNTFTKETKTIRFEGIWRFVALAFVFLFSVTGGYAQRYNIVGNYNVDKYNITSADPCNVVYKYVITPESGKENHNVVFYFVDDAGNTVDPDLFSLGNETYSRKTNDKGVVEFEGTLKTFYLNTSYSQYRITKDEPTERGSYSAGVSTKKSSVSLGDELDFELNFCSMSGVDESTLGFTYQWQNSITGGTSDSEWSDIAGATSNKLSYTAVYDYKYVRCVLNFNDGAAQEVISSVAVVPYVMPSFDVEITNVEKLNSFEHEVERWEDFEILISNVKECEVSNIVLEERPAKEGETYSASTAKKDGVKGWKLSISENKEYKVGIEAMLPHYGGVTKPVTFTKEVLVRSIYKVAEGVEQTVLFYDDFGKFNTSSHKYYYMDGDTEKSVDYESSLEGVINDVIWVADPNGYVVNHDFAMEDPYNGVYRRDADNNIVTDGEGKPIEKGCNNEDKIGDKYPYRCWSNGYRVEDGYYALVADPSKSDGGNNDYWEGKDHTPKSASAPSSEEGAMLFVNCSATSMNTVIYRRDIMLPPECRSNAYVLLSAYVSNASKKAGNAPVNVRFDIKNSEDKVVGTVSSGDVLTRDYVNKNWAHMTAAFKLSSPDGKYTVEITNNKVAGSDNPGNDVLLDDIEVILCYPDVQLSTDASSDEVIGDSVFICGKARKLNLTAFNKNDIRNYIPNPVYRFQYSSDNLTWYDLKAKSLTDNTNPNYVNDESGELYIEPATSVERPYLEIALNETKFNGKTYFRVIVANNTTVGDKVVAALSGEGAMPSLDCNTIYAVDSKLTVIFRPAGKSLFNKMACYDESLILTGDKNKPTAEWQRFISGDNRIPLVADGPDGPVVSINDNVVTYKIRPSILEHPQQRDTLAYILTEVTGCRDTQLIVMEKFKDLNFNFDGSNNSNVCVGKDFESEVKFAHSFLEQSASKPTGVKNLNYVFTVDGTSHTQSGLEFKVEKLDPVIYDYDVTVVGSADSLCSTTAKFSFSAYKSIDGIEIYVNGKKQGNDTVRVCLDESSESSTQIVLTAKVLYEGGDTLIHKNPEIADYYWYITKTNAQGVESPKDSLLAITHEPLYIYKPNGNERATFSVKVVDNVCVTDPDDAPSSGNSSVVDIHKPIKLTIEKDANSSDKLCFFDNPSHNDKITFNVDATNALDGNVKVTWYERNGDSVKELGTTSEVPASFTFTPKNDDTKMSERWMIVRATDKVCDTRDGADSASYKVYVPVKIKLETDAKTDSEGRLIKCIRKEEAGGDEVHFWIKVLAGDPNHYEWFKNDIHDATYDDKMDYFLKAEPGANKVDAYAYDGVCNVKCDPVDPTDPHCGGAGDPNGSVDVIGQYPLEISLSVSPLEICTGEQVELKAAVANSVDPEKVKILWSGEDVSDNDEVVKGESSGVNVSTKFIGLNSEPHKVTHTIEVKTLDSICANGYISDKVPYDVLVPLKITLTSDAVKYKDRLQKCIKSKNIDNFVTAKVTVLQGDPKSYVWSDGLYVGLVPSRQFVVNPGSNVLSVEAYDEVCSKSGDAISNDAKDEIEVIAQEPIRVELESDRNNYCEGEIVKFDFKVINSLDNKIESIWSEDGVEVYKNNGDKVAQQHKVSNDGTNKVTKKMEVKVLDEICREPAEYVKTTIPYDVLKKIKFTLTSNVYEDGKGDVTCIGEKSQTNPSGFVTLTITPIQGDPLKYVWSDGVEDELQRVVTMKVGKNDYSVSAYDNICSKVSEDAGFEGEKQSISIEAREPIEVSLERKAGRNKMCIGEEITLKYSVYNSLDPNAKSKLVWSSSTTKPSVLVDIDEMVNASDLETAPFAPNNGAVGSTIFTLTASEIGTDICPAQSASVAVESFNKASIDLITSDFAICQDTSTVDSDQEKNKLITLTAKVTDGDPKFIYFVVGNNVPMLENGSSVSDKNEVIVPVVDGAARLDILPLESYKYKAFGSDDICRASFEKELSGDVTVSHKIYLTLKPESEEVQMGDSSRFTVTTTLPFNGNYLWQLIDPEKKDLATTKETKYSKSQKKDGEYTYRVVIDNENCGISKSNKVTIYVADYNIVPNVITPYNGNPKNDTFMKGYEVSIFDRYQQVIYEGTDGWDATYRGQTVTPGTYFYIVKKKDGRVLKGTVEVYK